MAHESTFPLATSSVVRIRTTLEVAKGKVLSWATQLEWLDPEEDRWVWVVRYDTAGG
ncbi:DUF7718 family protein, partial [Thermus scotoductus]|uniref:DUF7718 family protein n=1 Tax=Thermus scotoductus TaxID=37636 RepID=UPI003F516D0A